MNAILIIATVLSLTHSVIQIIRNRRLQRQLDSAKEQISWLEDAPVK